MVADALTEIEGVKNEMAPLYQKLHHLVEGMTKQASGEPLHAARIVQEYQGYIDRLRRGQLPVGSARSEGSAG